jgi:hypothetical protein
MFGGNKGSMICAARLPLCLSAAPLPPTIDVLRRLDGEIEEVCRDLANAERQLKAT